MSFSASFCALFLLAATAFGQALEMTPDLIAALPWTDSPDGVKATQAFLLNDEVIVPAGSAIRLFYVRPILNEGDEKPQILNEGQSQIDAYSANGVLPGPSTGAVKGALPKAWQKTLKVAHETVWPNIASFREALDGMRGSDLRVVYKTPGAKDVSDEPFSPVEGLFLAESGGKVTVRAVQKESDAARNGFAAGDTIEKFDGAPMTSLSLFIQTYTKARNQTTLQRRAPYLFIVRHAGAAAAVDISLEAPISLGGSMLDQ